MPSVTQVINGFKGYPAAKQPRGGYLKPKSFKVTMLEDDPKSLNENDSRGRLGLQDEQEATDEQADTPNLRVLAARPALRLAR